MHMLSEQQKTAHCLLLTAHYRIIRAALALCCLLTALACAQAVTIPVLATGDMHGWMQSQPLEGGQHLRWRSGDAGVLEAARGL